MATIAMTRADRRRRIRRPASPCAPRGADLAREALAAARASTAARRKAAGRTPMAGRGCGRQPAPPPLVRVRSGRPGSAAARRDPAHLGGQRRRRRGPEEGDPVRAVGRRSSAPEVADHCAPVSLVGRRAGGAGRVDGLGDPDPDAGAAVAAPDQRRGRGPTVIRIRARGPAAPSWKFGYRHVSGPRAAGHLRLTRRVACEVDDRRTGCRSDGRPVPPPTHIR